MFRIIIVKHTLNFIITSFFLFATIVSCVTTQPQIKQSPEYNEYDVGSFISKMDSNFNTLGFKGLHLGMTMDEVNSVVKETPWGYQFHDKTNSYSLENSNIWPDLPHYKPTNFLKGDETKMGWTWAKIGCEGPKGKGSCYWIRSTFIRFYEKRLVKISISSPSWSANKIDSDVKEWARFALKGLVKKYGEPSKVFKTISQVNILDFKSGFNTSLYVWDFKKEEIKLTLGEYESKFYCSVKFLNVDGVSKLKELKKKSKSDF